MDQRLYANLGQYFGLQSSPGNFHYAAFRRLFMNCLSTMKLLTFSQLLLNSYRHTVPVFANKDFGSSEAVRKMPATSMFINCY